MPYSVIKVKGGWRVQIDHNPTHLLAKKPFKTKREATAQMHAIMQSEHARGVEGGVFGIPFLSTIYNLIPIRKKYNTTTTKFLNQYGNMPVQSIIIYRKPIVGAVNTALNMASFGQWGRAVKKNGYDKVFHLYMVATVKQSNGQPFNILIEKNDITWRKILFGEPQPRIARYIFFQKKMAGSSGACFLLGLLDWEALSWRHTGPFFSTRRYGDRKILVPFPSWMTSIRWLPKTKPTSRVTDSHHHFLPAVGAAGPTSKRA